MKKNLNTQSIKQLLNRSSAELGQPTLARLRDARMQALERFDARSTVPAFAWAGSASSHSGHAGDFHHKSRFWATAVLLAALLFSGVNYLQHLADHDNSDVDIAILTDDLPIDVYVD
jgi:hypothetical protein